jgi:uncharacterized protein YndB with AHSA1/START domain
MTAGNEPAASARGCGRWFEQKFGLPEIIGFTHNCHAERPPGHASQSAFRRRSARESVMVELKFEAEIGASAERVFSLLADLRDYDRWLPRSSAFHGTVTISEGPIAVGTTYVEPGPLGTRHGTVTEMDHPMRLAFEQPMTLKPHALGVIGIKLFHTLTPNGPSVHLLRALKLSPRGPVRLAMPFVVAMFRVENERMIRTLKTCAEANPA